VSGKRVKRLMRQAGISGLVRRKRGRTTIGVPVAEAVRLPHALDEELQR
jgi:hypothetical protein